MNNEPKVQRTILEVALLEGQFRLSIEGSPTAVQDGHLIVKALTRAREFLELVVKPEAALRERWRQEDEAGDEKRNAPLPGRRPVDTLHGDADENHTTLSIGDEPCQPEAENV